MRGAVQRVRAAVWAVAISVWPVTTGGRKESLSDCVSLNSPNDFAALVHYSFTVGRRFNPCLPVVESIYVLEASGVSRLTCSVNVMPAFFIAGASESFVENVESEKPSPVQQLAACINVGGEPVASLHDGRTFAEIARVDVTLVVGRTAITPDVKVVPVEGSHDAQVLLPVADPIETRVIRWLTIWLNVQPPIRCLRRSKTFVKAKHPEEALRVSGRSIEQVM